MSSRLFNTWMQTCYLLVQFAMLNSKWVICLSRVDSVSFFIIVFIKIFLVQVGVPEVPTYSIPAFCRFIEVCMYYDMWQEH